MQHRTAQGAAQHRSAVAAEFPAVAVQLQGSQRQHEPPHGAVHGSPPLVPQLDPHGHTAPHDMQLVERDARQARLVQDAEQSSPLGHLA
eukprot:CAMPEP_0201282172 /NCGR_PEP_ID=MMETSP1317-20130820/5009_1 /ASSEMBLY_ACC=CAM_ASM_000770 /TAXON_ID=187299 /ORGANISM="Undescribed Undescribed, Strain Undescribed" /LENGTH=88 /DNA_ID=CAMNT_0047594149 /DNA_START=345 /DNA_END=608 /DNA_ORIENTATION=+